MGFGTALKFLSSIESLVEIYKKIPKVTYLNRPIAIVTKLSKIMPIAEAIEKSFALSIWDLRNLREEEFTGILSRFEALSRVE